MENTESTNSNNSTEAPIVNNDSTQPENKTNKSKLSKVTVLSIVVLGFILVAGVATAAYTQIVLNNPDRLWQDATNNTRSGIDEVTALLEETKFNGGVINGDINVEAPIAATASLQGNWLNNNATINSETSIAGVQLNSEIRAVENSETSKSDFYFKIYGLNEASSFSDLLLPGSRPLLERANNNWYKIENSDIEDLGVLPAEIPAESLNAETYKEDVDKIKNLINDFLLTTDQTKTAFNYTPIGREDFNGRDAYKYDVKPNKERLEELLRETESIFKEAEILKLPGVEGIEEDINLDKLAGQNIDQEVKIEVWVDTDVRYFRNVRIYLDSNNEFANEATGNYIDFGLDFKGGEELPFYINYVSESNANNEQVNLLLSATLNQQSKNIKLQFDINANIDQQVIKAAGSLDITSSESEVEVQAPENYETIDSLIESFFGTEFNSQNTQLEGFDDSEFLLDDVEL